MLKLDAFLEKMLGTPGTRLNQVKVCVSKVQKKVYLLYGEITSLKQRLNIVPEMSVVERNMTPDKGSSPSDGKLVIMWKVSPSRG